jgi:hypothetical protein
MESPVAHPRPARLRASLLASALTLWLLAPLAHGAPMLGFTEHWTGTSLDGWGGGDNYSNPGAGGVLGAGDGFLVFSTPGPPPASINNLGAQSAGAEYAGDWEAAGITQVRFWLNDVGNADPLEIHFALGNSAAGNFWQYNVGFIPAHGSWTPFFVDLGSPANFTQIIAGTPGSTYDDALKQVDRVLIRHDLAPYVQSPDPIQADVGVDELVLADATTGVAPFGRQVPRPLQMAPPYPNPSRGPVVLALETFDDATITIQIVDVTGRIVRHAALARAAAGPHLWTWDGSTDSGANAPAGVYLVRAFAPSGGVSRSLIRLSRNH